MEPRITKGFCNFFILYANVRCHDLRDWKGKIVSYEFLHKVHVDMPSI
jgi:hypothetical protein